MKILVLLVILLVGIIELIELIIREPFFNFYNMFPTCKNYFKKAACSANDNLL